MIVWELDLQLPMQSVPITTNVLNSNNVESDVKHLKPINLCIYNVSLTPKLKHYRGSFHLIQGSRFLMAAKIVYAQPMIIYIAFMSKLYVSMQLA